TDRERSAQKTGAACWHWVPTCRAYGKRQPLRLAIARNCCERYSKRSSSPCLRPSTAPASPCGGEVEASPISMSICHARNRRSCAPVFLNVAPIGLPKNRTSPKGSFSTKSPQSGHSLPRTRKAQLDGFLPSPICPAGDAHTRKAAI